MGKLSLSQSGSEAIRSQLRRDIPRLFDMLPPGLVRRIESMEAYMPRSLAGALAVQRLLGGDIVPTTVGTSRSSDRQLVPQHVVNVIDGKLFDALGFVFSRVPDTEPITVAEDVLPGIDEAVAPLRAMLDRTPQVLK